MTKRKPNPQRGGRPRNGNVRHTVSLPPALWAHVDAQAGGNRSERLRLVVRRDAERSAVDDAAEKWAAAFGCSVEYIRQMLEDVIRQGEASE
jgi:hypothetical protein